MKQAKLDITGRAQRAVNGRVSLGGALALGLLLVAQVGCGSESGRDEEVGDSRGYLQASGGSVAVTWTCTGSPCPWGSPLNGQALIWPAEAQALSARLGYTASGGMYLPAAAANGAVLSIGIGTAYIYAGLPDAVSHRLVASVDAGESYAITGLATGEVVSVQSDSSFTYGITPGNPAPPQSPLPASEVVTWNCTGSPCPWGSAASGPALVWPAAALPTAARLGYTVTAGIYLPAASANGMTLALATGAATVYAGLPNASYHRAVTTLSAGQPYTVNGLAPGEVLSVQSDGAFTYQPVSPSSAPPPSDPGPTDPNALQSSADVTWSCTGSSCPWGSFFSGVAVAWPASSSPSSTRLGYTTSQSVYLPASAANGLTVHIGDGSASLYAGAPSAPSHRFITSLDAGETFQVTGLAANEVLSVQSGDAFTYSTIAGTPGPYEPPPPVEPTDEIQSVQAYWRCNTPGCDQGDWFGAVINWPSWAAYQNNARYGDSSRAVFGSNGEALYPYMGAWAAGCKVTARSGIVLLVEWQRGTDEWREIWLEPGQSHVIALSHPEDGAMIESYDNSPGFSVSLENCTPQPL